MPLFEDLKVFSGNAHTQLGNDIASYLNIPMGKCDLFKFSNDESFVKYLENIREKDVFLIQPITRPVNDNIMELLIMIDAARRASAGRITAVIPYYGYGRTDKKDQPRVAITARLIADFISISGADRVLTLNLHAGQIQGFFNIPLDELSAIQTLSKYYINKKINKLVIAATDIGAAKRARDMAELLDKPIVIIEKSRFGNSGKVEAMNLIGNVEGSSALIVDDEIDTGNSVIAAANVLKQFGAEDIYCTAVHPVFSGDVYETLDNSVIKEIVVTDTLPLNTDRVMSKIKIVSISQMLGEAIHRIHNGLSVGAMFEN
ncbi:MAG: ribose-phosphate pyrophosphokinase [Chloroflexi bacterium]|nr:ribose-phosphate pyrophosphokinase [Chloroflexota bacterium]MCH2308995.1 ribose-phosphate pyrophosphokinase [SAR202 cluster bacterium]MQG05963.1 ribose-phosphate pyrophosphokinase [SAR202 cluster bacterium]|tara:strand:+ start:169 stop:1119 length:951 start_codon:yes stop_codon:yes gene_type:complete